ncbi:L-fucose:H+ symporter permease [Ginsengibacter hankyongi]|uniref:L-fucose:H+ symporter permease n=1 Tax=Ginsengibacter hankyongi TaxID=2607284 RepID=A0A5J5IEQ6_9BACT|nr:L-fucose:H+ symporter permease [Ginsengibacter hankyongi]KAA9037580.1 L-fucose:H+ symporter permease [Ginsengibacter hankyongi]
MNNRNYTLPIILVTSLFFLWGLAYGLLDVLNKHFQETLNITKQRSTLLQAAYFGAYFLIALPAGYFMQKSGYRKGIITGLLLYATGAILFYPAAQNESFAFFLLALFVLASGLTFLETAANPYITVLGEPATSEFRLNLAQSFNGVGSFLGPIIGGALFFGNKSADGSSQLDTVKYVYIAIAGIVLLVALLFFRTPMPEVKEEELVIDKDEHVGRKLFQHTHFVWAIVAQFFYVAAQVGIAALFINYCTEKNVGIDNERASYLLSGSLVLFTAGRFAGTALMKIIAPHKLLALYALINICLCIVVVMVPGIISVYSLMTIFFFESIMFPTIFALGVKNLGVYTKKGASYIIMSIVGGALVPVLMGSLAQSHSTSFSYIVPMICFVFVFIFAVYGYKIKTHV